jgi:VanZ family protein
VPSHRALRALSLWAPVAAWMALIFLLSSRPLPPAGKALPDWANHAIGYGVLSILACRALAGGLRAPLSFSRAAVAIAFCALYGMSDEWHQSFVPSRTPEARDVMSDTVGASLAAAAFAAWSRS